MTSEWAAYAATRSLEARNALVVQYMHLSEEVVRKTFRAVRQGDQNYVSQADLVAVGYRGVIRGVETFDPSHGANPKTWIYHKIRSTILDELRRIDHLSRGDRKLAAKCEDTRDVAAVMADAGVDALRAAQIVRGENMGNATPMSVIEARNPNRNLGGACAGAPTSSDVGDFLKKHLGGVDPRHAFALLARFQKGWSCLKTAREMGYDSRPRWLRKIFALASFPLGTNWHPPSSDKGCHGAFPRKNRTFAALVRRRASRPRENGSVSYGA